MSQEIIGSSLAKKWLLEVAQKKPTSANICSAYIQSGALEKLFQILLTSKVPIRVLARWNLNDLISHSSDLATYGLCKQYAVDFYIKQDFHGKVYGIEPYGVLLGSFNLTSSGFSIGSRGNEEAGVIIESGNQSKEYFENLFASSKKIDDFIFSRIFDLVEEYQTSSETLNGWPDELQVLLRSNDTQSQSKLLVAECFWTTFEEFTRGLSDATKHDRSLLSITEGEEVTVEKLRQNLSSTKVFNWLLESLHQNDGMLYFGAATQALHEQLFDDPKPYRQHVKILLANLLSWISTLNMTNICIDRPNHSQRIQLKK